MNDRARVRRGARRTVPASLQSVCDRLPLGFALFDAEMKLAAWNARFAALRGYPRKLVKVGTSLESFVRFEAERGEYGEGAIDALVRDRLAALKRRRRVEREQALPDRRSLRIVCERVPEGGLLVTCEDVTDASRTAHRLRESEERYDFAMRATNEGMYDWDVANDTVHYSDRVYQAVGMSPDDYTTAAGWFERIHPDDQKRYLDTIRAHFKGETERFECDYRYRARDGAWHWARQHGLALRDASGRAVRLIGSTGNITELKERELQLAEHVAEQTAVRELLEAISRSAFDLDGVLRTLIESAARLCRADKGFIFRLEGDAYRLAFDYGGVAQAFHDFIAQHPIRAGRDTLVGRTALTKEVVHIEDVLADPEYRWPQSQRIGGQRTMLGVPIVRDGTVIGVIALWKERVAPFTPAQIGLVKAFANEALIAIENARLFGETKEALDQQTATSQVLGVISSSPTDLGPVYQTILSSITRLCEANIAALFLYDGEVLGSAASHGTTPEFAEHLARSRVRPSRQTTTRLAALERRTVHVADLLCDPTFSPEPRDLYERESVRTVLSVPMLREGALVGVITTWRREVRPFTDKQVALVRTFADQAVIAIENVRLFNELEARNRELTGALDREKATAEILRVISGSPTDIQPVLDAVAERAGQLCESPHTNVLLADGDRLKVMSVYSTEPGPKPDRGNFVPIDRAYINGRAVLDREVVHIPDVLPLLDTEFPDIRRNQRKFGFRAVLVVPLMREGRAVGTIFIWRREPGLFSDDQVALLQTFADQAVIAIENVRLFNELQARNRELTEALEQQTATGEILRVISSSPTDLAPVFDAVAKSVSRLCDAPDVVIVRSEGEFMRFAASVGPFGRTFGPDLAVPIARGSVAGRAVLEHRTIHVHDLAAERDDEFPEGKALQRRYGHRTMVAAPLLLGNTALGAIAMLRTEVRPFSDKQLALLRTFADQAVIAIENVRLFHEIREKSHQLEIANQHKSAFLANMSHELRTPLNAVIGFSEMLAARYFGSLTEKQAEYVNDIHGSGRHLLSLINDILDLSKIEAGRMELELGEFDLRAALDNALTLVRERAQRGGVTLRLDADGELGGFLGDERKLKQVMLNLLSNAVKFTPRGGAVSVAARRVDGAAEIAVSDTGAGIAPEDQEAIFEAFRQVGTDITRKREGTGLGLALTRRFVELHGGTIRVESALDKGSTFTVRLPIRHGE